MRRRCLLGSIFYHVPLTRCVKLRVVHAPGMPGSFFPSPRVSNPDMHHGTCVTHVPWCMPRSLTSGFLWNRWRGKRFLHSRHMRNPQFCVSGKRLMLFTISLGRYIPLCVPGKLLAGFRKLFKLSEVHVLSDDIFIMLRASTQQGTHRLIGLTFCVNSALCHNLSRMRLTGNAMTDIYYNICNCSVLKLLTKFCEERTKILWVIT